MTSSATPTSHARRLTAFQRAVLGFLGAVLLVGFVALGTWQVQRRAWKLALIERVEQRVHATPVAVPAPARWPRVNAASHGYLPVTLKGRWLGHATVLVQAVTELGSGFWVLTPLQTTDDTQVWVNRGFVPEAQRARWLAPGAIPDGGALVRLQGLLRMSEPGGGFLRTNEPAQERWYSRDVVAMSQAQRLPKAAPFFVDAGLPGESGATQDWPRPGLTVIRFHNNHLVYALTWYGLALMVAGAFATVARYSRRHS